MKMRESRVICIPCEEAVYNKIVGKTSEFRAFLDSIRERYPEIFPPSMGEGYLMKDARFSEKLKITIRRIKIGNVSYTIRPCFVMPYMTGFTADIEKPLFLRKFSVPYWAIAYVHGRSAMYWYRIEQQLGHFNLVGTTVRNHQCLPKHLLADEKHTRLSGNKAYLATTVANDCILGASISLNADDKGLTEAYSKFKFETKQVNPNYKPITVNTDGWSATINAWKAIYPNIVTILCFLHVFIKLRDRGKKKFKEGFEVIASKLWNAYEAKDKRSFSQRIRRLLEKAQYSEISDQMRKTLQKLHTRRKNYSIAYEYKGAHRTSNMLDRLMQFMDRHLFSMRYFHSTAYAAEMNIRGWSLIYNFAPSCPAICKKYKGFVSPAERLNNFKYSELWLENLLISGSLQAKFGSPPNPL